MTPTPGADVAVRPVDGCHAGRVLALAACYLPCLASPPLVLESDLHDALWEAAVFLGADGRVQAHRWADEAESSFVGFLVRSGRVAPVAPGGCERCLLRSWVQATGLAVAAQDLYRAAGCYQWLHVQCLRVATAFGAAGVHAFLLGHWPSSCRPAGRAA